MEHYWNSLPLAKVHVTRTRNTFIQTINPIPRSTYQHCLKNITAYLYFYLFISLTCTVQIDACLMWLIKWHNIRISINLPRYQVFAITEGCLYVEFIRHIDCLQNHNISSRPGPREISRDWFISTRDTLSSRIITKLPQTGLRIKISTFVYTLKNKLFEDGSILYAWAWYRFKYPDEMRRVVMLCVSVRNLRRLKQYAIKCNQNPQLTLV